jgi:GNAT superfamily N-acetyltransferase
MLRVESVRVREALPTDAAEMATLFFETVHAVNRRDYTAEQIEAWAPQPWKADQWAARQAGKTVAVAVDGDRVLGFAEFDPHGHIDCFYTHKDRQGQGIGSLLLADLERRAQARGVSTLTADVSITAKMFFERRGFKVLREQQVVRRGVALTNYAMDKRLT